MASSGAEPLMVRVSAFMHALGRDDVRHPLIEVIHLDDLADCSSFGNTRYTFGFYCVVYKDARCGTVRYGRNEYDYDNGTLLFFAPDHDVELGTLEQSYQGVMLIFSPALMQGIQMSPYTFFGYSVNEALHVSERECQQLHDILGNIETELERGIDRHTRQLMAQNVALILNYCVRFYDRQFITREPVDSQLMQRFTVLLDDYFAHGLAARQGVPTVRYYFDDNGDSYGVTTSHRKGIVTMPVVMPLIIKGMCSGNAHLAPYGVEEFLSQQMIDTGVLDWIDSKEYTTDEIAKKWYQQVQNGLEKDGRQYTPAQMAELFETPKENVVWGRLEKMLTPACYAYLSDPNNFVSVPTEATNAMQALHIALAENSTATGWTLQHRIKFYHSKNDMVVPYGNYQSFLQTHTPLLGNLISIDDTFSAKDHLDAGITFFQDLAVFKKYGATFNWLKGGPTTGIKDAVQSSEFNVQSYYDLQGRRLSGKPTKSGIYITKQGRIVLYYNRK